jgi:hypothetical protein
VAVLLMTEVKFALPRLAVAAWRTICRIRFSLVIAPSRQPYLNSSSDRHRLDGMTTMLPLEAGDSVAIASALIVCFGLL